MASRYTKERILSSIPSQIPSEHPGSSDSCQGYASGPGPFKQDPKLAGEGCNRTSGLPCPTQGEFHSKYFLVRKKDGSFRPILDLSRLKKEPQASSLPHVAYCRCSTCNRTRNVVYFSGPEGCGFSHPHHPTSQKVTSVHFCM